MLITLADLAPPKRSAWLTPLIAPRPIAFVSTLSAAGAGNLSPFSFFAMGGGSPQSVAFCPVADRDGNPKDTLRNVLETGEFVINIVTRSMAERVNATSAHRSRIRRCALQLGHYLSQGANHVAPNFRHG